MPRETIRRLSADLERVLIAGAHLAAADQALARDKAALDGLAAQFGAKAPVLGQLAAAAGSALAAGPADAAKEVVGLATMAAQVRAAQAQPAPVAATAPLTARPEIGTPCNAKELGELYNALVERGKGRQERVQQSIERGDIADLRLVEPLIHAMNDGYIGDLVATKAVPRLGAAIVAPIRHLIDFAKGRAIDGRRLRAVVAADPAGACDLLARALAEGNAELRECACDAIADHRLGDPQFEAAVLALVGRERSGGVFRAALRALGGYASDAALASLTGALDDARTVHAAAEALGHSRHAQALPLLLQRLEQAVQAAAKKPKKKDPAAKPAANSVEPAEMVEILLRALSGQRDPRIAAAALPLVGEHGAAAAQAALPSADPAQLATLADLLAGDDAELFPVAAEAAARLGGDQAFKRLSAAFAAKDREKKVGLARIEAAAERVREAEAPDPRWAALALKQLAAPKEVALAAIPLLGKLKERTAVKPLLKLLDAKEGKLTAAAVGALGEIGGEGLLDALLPHLGHRDWSVRWAVHHAIVALDDPASVDQVRTLVVAAGDTQDWTLRHLLRTLERCHPGR